MLLIEANAEVKEHLRHFRHSHDTFATLEPTNIFSPNCVLNFGVLTQMAWLGIFSSTMAPNSYAATGI